MVKIIKIRSFWKIDRRRGNYRLPSGDSLLTYVERLVREQLDCDGLRILENGELAPFSDGDWNPDTNEFNAINLFPSFAANEICSEPDQERRIKNLAREIVG